MDVADGTSATRRLLYATHGLTTHDRRFVEAAVEAGWHVHYVRFDGGSHVLDNRGLPAGVVEHDWLGAQQAFGPDRHEAFVDAFAEVLAAVHPTVVHAGPIPTVGHVVTRAMQITVDHCPVVLMSWASDLLIDVQRDPAAMIMAREALAASAGVIVDCTTIADIATALGARPDRMLVVPWGVDLEQIRFVAPRPAARPLQLLSLRTHEAIYDVEALVRACAIVRDEAGAGALRVTIAGSGSLSVGLEALAHELALDDDVRWIGRIDEDAVLHELAACDVHVSTSHSDGSSISLLQAMAVGRPSIVTDIPSNREWVQPGVNGWLFPVADADGLARAITDLLRQPTLPATMAPACRSTVEERADWRKNRRHIGEFYERVVSSWS